MHKYTLLVLCCYLLATSCTRSEDTQPTPAREYISFIGLEYGPDTLQKLDLYLPAGRNMFNTPIVIMIHGGGWTGGERGPSFAPSVIARFTDLGYAVANIDYRFATNDNNKFPTQLDDIDAVVGFLEHRRNLFAINTGKIGLMGRSAGSHLGLLYAYTRNPKKCIKVVLDFFGPTDLTDPTVKDSSLKDEAAEFIGRGYTGSEEIWHEASPIFYTSTGVPTYIFQGNYDQTVYPIQAQRLRDSLMAHNIPCLYEDDWDFHGLDSIGWQKHLDKALPFIDKFMH